MATSDWITIVSVIVSVAFGSGVVIARANTRFSVIEGDIREIKKELRKITRPKLTRHDYRLKDHDKRLRKLESR